MIREQIKPAFLSLIFFTLITGVLYPLLVTGISAVLFKKQAEGSLLFKGGKPAGSELIGQAFDAPGYLWGRPSSTAPSFNASASSGSNYGPMNPDYLSLVEARVKTLKDADPENRLQVPVDLVTASASGLDPHLSLAGAYYQIPRIARVRKLPESAVKEIIQKNIQGRWLGILGEPAVNVLKVNLLLDETKEISQ